MARPRCVPSYRKHKQSGQAIVTLTDAVGRRRDVLLGQHSTPESRAEYARAIAEWEAHGQQLQTVAVGKSMSINELLLAYWKFAQTYYQKNGQPTTQLDRIERALKPVKERYGQTLACDFGPLALKAVREWMIQKSWARGYINSCVGCIKRVFKWGVAEELVPPSVYHGLQAVEGLKRGRSAAPESRRIRPVSDGHVEATVPYMTRPVRAMVQLQRIAGMRPGEVTIMRPCDIDRSGPVWVYRPESHKTEHHGIERVIFLGPQAQEILKPFLFRDPSAYLFSPKEAVAEFRAKQRQNRKTKVQPSQQNRKKHKPRRQPGDHYTVTGSYGHGIARAIKAANDARACEECKALPAEDRCNVCKTNMIPS
jgi:hypothetical protein